MKIRYTLDVQNPQNHLALVKMKLQKLEGQDRYEIFLPAWSPGSYLMREYMKNLRWFRVHNDHGEELYFEQTTKNTFLVETNKIESSKTKEIHLSYEIYCHELTVRTSHIDESHAFIHGPSVFMGLLNCEYEVELEIKANPLWSKIHTGLKEISQNRDEFIYHSPNYDDFVDCPIEMGCHESDGFMAFDKEHFLCFYGEQYPHDNNLKQDIKKIVETVGSIFSRIPYENYTFMTHFSPNLYGGLEHKNSTALQFDGRKMGNRSDYVNWLCLVSHEYFHTWNVKRIRPIELGPFDYINENYTRMHWLTEGLTSFMDELLVLKSGLISLEEYLGLQVKNLNRYFSTPGKKFHSLEDSSFNAWIKLYRPDENSKNSSISYYLKGGLVFSTLHFELKKFGKSIYDLIDLLWQSYEKDKTKGLVKEQVLKMIEEISDEKTAELFDLRLTTTEDIDFESYYKEYGMNFVYEGGQKLSLGADLRFDGQRVFIKSVNLDEASYVSGLNAGDEILAINGQRFLKSDVDNINSFFKAETRYTVTVSRLGQIFCKDLIFQKEKSRLKAIELVDSTKAKEIF